MNSRVDLEPSKLKMMLNEDHELFRRRVKNQVVGGVENKMMALLSGASSSVLSLLPSNSEAARQ